MSKSYWVQKSHSYLIQKFKQKMPNYDEEKKKAIDCLRSKDTKCIQKYSIERSLDQLKEELSENSSPSDNPNHSKLIGYDYTINNESLRAALASCLEKGKVMTDFFSVPVNSLISTTMTQYSTNTISIYAGYSLDFECFFGFRTDKSGELKTIQIGFSHHLDI